LVCNNCTVTKLELNGKVEVLNTFGRNMYAFNFCHSNW